MKADESGEIFVLNPRSSAFIGGYVFFINLYVLHPFNPQ
jgi:hypothetical protein